MPHTLIKQCPSFIQRVKGENKLAIAEMFCDTIQGEGLYAGVPATFIRLQGCTLKCSFCDTLNVWPQGNEYSFDEIFKMWESVDLVTRLRDGQHLILTGGSPLKQESRLIGFITAFVSRYHFKPFIEVENEAVLAPSTNFEQFVDWWNNSPKLSNSGMKHKVRVKPAVMEYMARLTNSSFKFVVSSTQDWQEIVRDYIEPFGIRKEQIILMPEGQTQAELQLSRPIVAQMAIDNQVRLSDRLHVTIWDRATAV